MDQTQVIVERTYNAPPEKVWEAITNPDQMKEWYLPVEEFQPEVGFETSFEQEENGKVYPHVWKVTEVIPERKISYAWRLQGFPGNSLVTFELAPDGEGTKLTVTHMGLDSFRGDLYPDLAVTNIKEGWEYFINDSLPQFLADTLVPAAY